jgi:hypothetical protein
MEGLLLYLTIPAVPLVTTVIVLVIVIWKRTKTNRFKETKFHTFYVMGLVFIPFGTLSMAVYSRLGMSFFFVMPFFTMGITIL